jgi:hypothetical protein
MAEEKATNCSENKFFSIAEHALGDIRKKALIIDTNTCAAFKFMFLSQGWNARPPHETSEVRGVEEDPNID